MAIRFEQDGMKQAIHVAPSVPDNKVHRRRSKPPSEDVDRGIARNRVGGRQADRGAITMMLGETCPGSATRRIPESTLRSFSFA